MKEGRSAAEDNEGRDVSARQATTALVSKKRHSSSNEKISSPPRRFFSRVTPRIKVFLSLSLSLSLLTAKFRPPTPPPLRSPHPPPPRSSWPFLFYSPYLVTEFDRRRRRPMPFGLRRPLFPRLKRPISPLRFLVRPCSSRCRRQTSERSRPALPPGPSEPRAFLLWALKRRKKASQPACLPERTVPLPSPARPAIPPAAFH